MCLRPAGCYEIRSRTAVAFVAFRDVNQMVSESPPSHVDVATILTLNRDRQRLFLPDTKFMRHFHQRTETDPIPETSPYFGGGEINEGLHKSISDMPSTETL